MYHGFTEFYLEGKWVKATPAFNRELCRRHRVAPLGFDSREDSLFQAYDMENKRYMEYLAYHGSFSDIPLDDILAAWDETYGKERVRSWIHAFETSGRARGPDFYKEEVLKPL